MIKEIDLDNDLVEQADRFLGIIWMGDGFVEFKALDLSHFSR